MSGGETQSLAQSFRVKITDLSGVMKRAIEALSAFTMGG
jgi:hypothetical protein